jgi:hypothetical protein
MSNWLLGALSDFTCTPQGMFDWYYLSSTTEQWIWHSQYKSFLDIIFLDYLSRWYPMVRTKGTIDLIKIPSESQLKGSQLVRGQRIVSGAQAFPRICQTIVERPSMQSARAYLAQGPSSGCRQNPQRRQ